MHHCHRLLFLSSGRASYIMEQQHPKNPHRLAYYASYGTITPESPQTRPVGVGLSFQSRPWGSMMRLLKLNCLGTKLGLSLVFRWIIFTALLVATAGTFAWSTIMGYLLGTSLLVATVLLGISNCCTEDSGVEGLIDMSRPPHGGCGYPRNKIMTIGDGSDSTGLESSLQSVETRDPEKPVENPNSS